MRRQKHAHKECMSLILVSYSWCVLCYGIHCAETNVWAAKKTMGESPKAMSSSGVVCGNNLYVFGGVLNGEAQNTIHCLDISEFIIISTYSCLFIGAPRYHYFWNHTSASSSLERCPDFGGWLFVCVGSLWGGLIRISASHFVLYCSITSQLLHGYEITHCTNLNLTEMPRCLSNSYHGTSVI